MGKRLEIGLSISRSELARFSCGLSEYSFNGFTKLSPISWVEDSQWMTIFVDRQMSARRIERCRSKYKFGILLESSRTFPAAAAAALKSEHRLDLILTHDDKLLERGPPYCHYIPGGTLLNASDSLCRVVKSSQASISVSRKIELEGHQLRHRVVRELAPEFGLEVFGYGYKPYVRALTPYENFRYTVVIENEISRYNISEKILEPLLCRTVPIYWGTAEVLSRFDPKGIIVFESVADLRSILRNISNRDYENRMESIEANFVTAKKYVSKEMNVLRAIHSTGIVSGIETYLADPIISEGTEIEPCRNIQLKPTSRGLSIDRALQFVAELKNLMVQKLK